jgi:hypothetical protein
VRSVADRSRVRPHPAGTRAGTRSKRQARGHPRTEPTDRHAPDQLPKWTSRDLKPNGLLDANLAAFGDESRRCDGSVTAVSPASRRGTIASRPRARPVRDPSRQGHPSPPAVWKEREHQRDNDTDRYELKAQSGQVARAADRKGRARSPSSKTAYPSAFSQEGSCPGSPDSTIRT